MSNQTLPTMRITVYCLILALVSGFALGYDYTYGKTFILHPWQMTWMESSEKCKTLNGTLATIYDVSTLWEFASEENWFVWVGLKIEEDEDVPTQWENGDEVTYPSNLHRASDDVGPLCLAMDILKPFQWKWLNCSEVLPYICMMDEGECTFELTVRSSLVGYNQAKFYHLSLEECEDQCALNEGFICRSFEYNPTFGFCQLSTENKFTQPDKFAQGQPDWDYYHRSCFHFILLGNAAPNVTVGTESTEAYTTPTTPVTTPTTTNGRVVCLIINDNVENETNAQSRDIVELQEMGNEIKENRKILSRTSMVDRRPSATYMGTIAVVIVMIVLGAVVTVDLLTLGRHCDRHCRKKSRRSKKKNKGKPDVSTVPKSILERNRRLRGLHWSQKTNDTEVTAVTEVTIPDETASSLEESWTSFPSITPEPRNGAIFQTTPTSPVLSTSASLDDIALVLNVQNSEHHNEDFHPQRLHEIVEKWKSPGLASASFPFRYSGKLLKRRNRNLATSPIFRDVEKLDSEIPISTIHLKGEANKIFSVNGCDVLAGPSGCSENEKYVLAYGYDFDRRL